MEFKVIDNKLLVVLFIKYTGDPEGFIQETSILGNKVDVPYTASKVTIS